MKLHEAARTALVEREGPPYPTGKDGQSPVNKAVKQIYNIAKSLDKYYIQIRVNYLSQNDDGPSGSVYLVSKDGYRVTVFCFDAPKIEVSVEQGYAGFKDYRAIERAYKLDSAELKQVLLNPGSLLKPDSKNELVNATITSVQKVGSDGAISYMCQIKLASGKTVAGKLKLS